MAMDPDSNRFVPLTAPFDAALKKIPEQVFKVAGTPDPEAPSGFVQWDGKPVPSHWTIFTVGEDVVIKGYTFRVAYIGETAILFEPVGTPIIEEDAE